MQKKITFILLILFFCTANCFAQQDTVINLNESVSVKPTATKDFSPRKATIRSAIIPGWGQAYNKKYWKIPLIYGALGVTTGILVYNIRTYNDLKQAYIYKVDSIPDSEQPIKPDYVPLSPEATRSYRNSFRQNVDYSVLFLILFWGLNVVDATVDAHLKGFDINDDLSLKFRPGYSDMANTNGISVVLKIGK